ncbi:MAG: hypothetical protein HY879_16455 [Deltaproteobacteria bacterium]|nr:hypothetical protein [Deltaproteobacteria bacterium]
MESAASVTMTKMLETLPESLQDRVLEHMRDYIEDIRDEAKWNESFSKTQNKLVAVARQARKEIGEGKATPMNMEKL